jgi:hypothetical protein
MSTPTRGDAVRRAERHPFHRAEAESAMERLAGEGRHEREPLEALAARRPLARLEDRRAEVAPVHAPGTNIARTRADSLAGSSRRASSSPKPDPV